MQSQYKKLIKKTKRVLSKAVPLWMLLLLLLLNSSMVLGLLEYYIMKKNLNAAILELSKKTQSPEELVLILKQQVLPQKGYSLAVQWNDIGKQLISTGVIDKTKYEKLFASDPSARASMKYLTHYSKDRIVINEKNAHFMVNTLWAFGLVNKSKILDEGSMKTYGEGDHMNFASTGGWNLGNKEAKELYSSAAIITLTKEQEKLVEKIAQNVYRPCCGNHTAFPDCNHGMAALGYIQLAVKQGVPEERIYKDLLALNSFWFPQNYVELAAYFKKENIQWSNVDSKLALSSQYSSGQGAAQVRQSIQGIPGLNVQGRGGCGT